MIYEIRLTTLLTALRPGNVKVIHLELHYMITNHSQRRIIAAFPKRAFFIHCSWKKSPVPVAVLVTGQYGS